MTVALINIVMRNIDKWHEKVKKFRECDQCQIVLVQSDIRFCVLRRYTGMYSQP